MTSWWLTLLDEQRLSGYSGVAGAHASVRLPVSDRLVTGVLRQRIPPHAPVRDVEIQALAGDRFNVRVRLKKPAFLPPLQVQLSIVRQPELPGSPTLILRFGTSALSALAAPVLGLFNVLPPGVQREGDHLLVDLQQLAEMNGLAEYLRFFTTLEVKTEPGRVVVSVDANVPPLP
jgi:hypothetical protein